MVGFGHWHCWGGATTAWLICRLCSRRGCVGLLVLLPDLGLLKMGLLVLVSTWMCGSVGVVAGFGSIKGGFVGVGVDVGVWVYWCCCRIWIYWRWVCWYWCRRECVGLLVLVPAWVCGFVGGIAGVGVWVCWWCCPRGYVSLFVLLPDLSLLKVGLLVVLPAWVCGSVGGLPSWVCGSISGVAGVVC